MTAPVRIANCSGFYGDRFSAALEMVEGGPIDYLTGDYLAELTLSILQKDRQEDPRLGYAKTFPLQLRQVAARCLERGIRIVVNAGGLNPAACAEACREVYRDLGLEARVAHIEGDDLLPRLDALQAAGETFEHLDRSIPLRDLEAPILGANAYLGAWGIVRALDMGADLVVCPRVTDASLAVGPAAFHFGWKADDWNRLAGAVVAGHVLECGAQATGGNYSHFRRVPGLEHPGFPVAAIEEDGSATIYKLPGTGGEVSVGTVTAQLLYEIDAPRYLNPDVTARFDTIRIEQNGEDRVRLHGVRGEPPPERLKVCINYAGGWKNSVSFLMTGPDIDAKRDLVERTLFKRLGGREAFAETRCRLHRARDDDGPFEESFSFFTVAVKDADPARVGRRFSGAAVETALASYPGLNLTAPPSSARPFAVYWPALVSRKAVTQAVVCGGERIEVPSLVERMLSPGPEPDPGPPPVFPEGRAVESPLGAICGARSGDKGGNANLGLWADSEAAFHWMWSTLTPRRIQELIPEARDLAVDRFVFPNLRALNFVLRGFLGDGVAASLAVDPQAKGLGEYVRAKRIHLPASLLDPSVTPQR